MDSQVNFSLYLVMMRKIQEIVSFCSFCMVKLPMLLNAWSLLGTYLFILHMMLMSGTSVSCLASYFSIASHSLNLFEDS